MVPDGFILDGMAVEGWLRMLAMLDADALRADITARRAGLSQATSGVRLLGGDGVLAELRLGKSEGVGQQAIRFVQGNADGQVYSLGQGMVERVLVGLPALRKRTQMMPPGGVGSIDPAALSKLPPEIREQIMQQLAQQEREKALMEQQRPSAP